MSTFVGQSIPGTQKQQLEEHITKDMLNAVEEIFHQQNRFEVLTDKTIRMIPVSQFPVGSFNSPIEVVVIGQSRVAVYGSAKVAGDQQAKIQKAAEDAARLCPGASVFVTNAGEVLVGEFERGFVKVFGSGPHVTPGNNQPPTAQPQSHRGSGRRGLEA